MVPELGFSVQRQWFPKKSDRNVVCHSPKLSSENLLFWRHFHLNENVARKMKTWKFTREFAFPFVISYVTSVWSFCSASATSRISQRRMRSLIDSVCLPCGPWNIFRWWCGFWKNPAASSFQTSYAQGCHSQRWQKRAVFKSSREIWQLQLFILEFHFFTWHLIEGEYYWMSIIFFKCIPKHEKIHHLRTSFSSETWIQLYKANAKDGFRINKILIFSLREIICFSE